MISGVDVLIKVETAPSTMTAVGGQKGASLSRSMGTTDRTTKDSGKWKEAGPGHLEWGVECDGLLITGDIGYEALKTAFTNRDKVKVEMAFPDGSKESGMAYITDFPIDAPYDDEVSYSVSLQGTGALTTA